MKTLAIAFAATAAFAASAFAADIPARAPEVYRAPPPAPVMTWTGCFIGAGGGYGMWHQEITPTDDLGAPLGIVTTTVGGKGWFGTVQGGCDYQIGSSWVIGVFADGDWGSIKGNPAIDINIGVVTGEEKLTSSWAVGGRIGWLVLPNLLTYFSGGYTQAQFDSFDLVNATGGASIGNTIPAHTYGGYFLGSGYEYGLGFMPGLFWKTEYRFADYSAADLVAFDSVTNAPVGFGANTHKYVQTIRSELVWRFWSR